MTERLRVVLHAEVVLDALWGSPKDWGDDALEAARHAIGEDFFGLLEEAVGDDDLGGTDIAKLVQSAEWVTVD